MAVAMVSTIATAMAQQQVRRVDDVPGGGLQRRDVREPGAEAQHGAERRGDHADDRAVGHHDQPDVAFGGAERGEHAERPQPPLGHHGEPGHRHQADEHQPEHGHHQNDRRGRDPGQGAVG